jgi:hypothetical protein
MDVRKKPRWLERVEKEWTKLVKKALQDRSMDDIFDDEDEAPGFSIPPSKLAPLLLAYNKVRDMGLDPIYVLRVVATPRVAVPPQRGGGRPTTRGAGEDCLKLYPRLRVLAAMARVARESRGLEEAERERQLMHAARAVLSELSKKHPGLNLDWLRQEEIAAHARWLMGKHDAAWNEQEPFHERQAAIARMNSLGSKQISDRDQETQKQGWRRVEQAFTTNPFIRPPSKTPLPQVLPSPLPPRRYPLWMTHKALLEAGEAERKRMSNEKKAAQRMRAKADVQRPGRVR